MTSVSSTDGGGRRRGRPATVLAGVVSVVALFYVLLTPTNVFLLLAVWGFAFGTAYFGDAYGVLIGDDERRHLPDTHSRAEQALAFAVGAIVVGLAVLSAGFPEGLGLLLLVGGGVAALALTVVCWRRRERSGAGRSPSRALR